MKFVEEISSKSISRINKSFYLEFEKNLPEIFYNNYYYTSCYFNIKFNVL